MHVTYKNTLADMVGFSAYHFPRMPILHVMVAVFVLGMTHNVFTIWQKNGAPVLALMITLVRVAGLFYFVMALGMLLWVVVSHHPWLNKTVLTEHRVTISEAGVTEETAVSRSEQKWASVAKVAQNRRHILVYTSQDAAHVIPKKAFPDAAAAVAFHDRAYQLWSAARQNQ